MKNFFEALIHVIIIFAILALIVFIGFLITPSGKKWQDNICRETFKHSDAYNESETNFFINSFDEYNEIEDLV